MRFGRVIVICLLTAAFWVPGPSGLAASGGPPPTVGISLDGLATARTFSAKATAAPINYSAQVSAPMPFSMVAFDIPAGSVVWFRTAQDGKWAPWSLVELYPDDEGPDDISYGNVQVSHPMWVKAADSIQLRVQDGAPEDVAIHLIDSSGLSRGPVDKALDALRPSTAQAATRPGIVTRAQWGADESWRTGQPSYAQVRFGVVHHTAGSNDYKREDSPAIVRGIYYYHTKVRGWSDIGYNLLVDRFGTVFEGRYGGVKRGVIGAHAANFNTGSFGISLMGNFDVGPASAAMLEAAYQAVAWKYEVHGLNPQPNASFTKNDTEIRVLNGHRDVGQTACPGSNVYPVLDSYRARIPADIVPGWAPLRGDWDGDGRSTAGWFKDGYFVMVNDAAEGAPQWVFRFGRAGDRPVVGDWDGDGRETIGVVRGDKWYLRNTNSGGKHDTSFWYGRSDGSDLPIAGDWDGDGADTIGMIRNRRWHLRNSLSGGSSDVSFVYGRVTEGDLPLIGDWNGDGVDTMGIVRDGEWHLRNSHTQGPGELRFIYGRVSRGDRPLSGDWTGRGSDGPGIVRGSGFHLRKALSGGSADLFYPVPGPDA